MRQDESDPQEWIAQCSLDDLLHKQLRLSNVFPLRQLDTSTYAFPQRVTV